MKEKPDDGKTLLLLRHAKSSWKDETLADSERPLNERGQHEAPRMGAWLRRQELLPDLILSSSARRAHDTTELVVEASGYEGQVIFTAELYHGGPQSFIEALRHVPDACQSVMLVGHNPELELFLETLTGVPEHLPTGGLAMIALPIASWQELHEGVRGKLRGLWSPKTLE